jgi:hypothetical protein
MKIQAPNKKAPSRGLATDSIASVDGQRKAQWRVIRWHDQPADTSFSVPFDCVCGHSADLPAGQLIGGTLIGMTQEGWMIFDPPWFKPPENWLPTQIQCRKCGRQLISTGLEEEQS